MLVDITSLFSSYEVQFREQNIASQISWNTFTERLYFARQKMFSLTFFGIASAISLEVSYEICFSLTFSLSWTMLNLKAQCLENKKYFIQLICFGTVFDRVEWQYFDLIISKLWREVLIVEMIQHNLIILSFSN